MVKIIQNTQKIQKSNKKNQIRYQTVQCDYDTCNRVFTAAGNTVNLSEFRIPPGKLEISWNLRCNFYFYSLSL